jgi:tetratricopeptide (TPR) repeat protein
LAVARADVRRAEVLFGALEVIRPQAAFAYIGLAMAYLNAGRADDAVQVLDRGLRNCALECQPELHSFRGLALSFAGRTSESVRALEAAGSHRLARTLLGDLDSLKSTI